MNTRALVALLGVALVVGGFLMMVNYPLTVHDMGEVVECGVPVSLDSEALNQRDITNQLRGIETDVLGECRAKAELFEWGSKIGMGIGAVFILSAMIPRKKPSRSSDS